MSLLVSGSAVAAGPGDFGGGPGEIPTPFLSSNQKVELADGELYTLVGVVRFFDGQAYLEVDMNEHPWLANQRRRSVPFYALESSPTFWKQYEGQRLRTYMEAHGSVVMPDGAPAEYVIRLQPLAEPVRLTPSPTVGAGRRQRR
jgi:hypothetical protein